jgi:hypothetical protein
MPCKRKSGLLRAFFSCREDAEKFAADPANHPTYQGDIAHKCGKCGYWHLSKISWVVPEWDSLEETVRVVN